VQLKLEAYFQSIHEDPICKKTGFNRTPYRREEDGVPPVESPFQGHLTSPFVIASGGDDKLDLIVRLQQVKIGPKIVAHHPTVRALDVADYDNPGINRGQVAVATGLKQDGPAGVEEPCNQLVDRRLQKRLASGDLYQLNRISQNLLRYAGC
jgi:hypothetical protein